MTTHINELRRHLMDTLADLRCKTNPMEPNQARAIAQVAGVLVDTARVEIEFLKVTGEKNSLFLEALDDETNDVARLTTKTDGLPNGINSVTRHRLQK